MTTDETTPEWIEELLEKTLPSGMCELKAFERWFEPIKSDAQLAVAEIYERVDSCLEKHREEVARAEGHSRDVFTLFPASFGRSLTKSPESVRTKIGRELCELRASGKSTRGTLLAGTASAADVEQRVLAMNDLGRFRIVAELSADVKLISSLLVPSARPRKLLGRYPVHGTVKDYVFDLKRRHPARGHRARQLAVKVPVGARTIKVEIQIMTSLQHAWDRRNHPMYEWTRVGGRLPDRLVINDVALAETLHLVDQQATANWKDFVKHTRRAT